MAILLRLVVFVVVVFAPQVADAGRGRFAWLYGTELVPEKRVV